MLLFQGVLYGLLAAATFGLIPLFTLPLIKAGYSIPCILFYRFFLGAVAMGIFLRLRHHSLLAGKEDSLRLFILGFVYIISGIPFFTAFHYIDSGLVATLQFSYPVLVVVLMVCFFREKLTVATAAAVLMAVSGAAVLSLNPAGGVANIAGVALALCSAVLTAIYVTGIQVMPLKEASGLCITMYPLLCGSFYSFIYAVWDGSLVLPRTAEDWGCFVLQAVVTCVISNAALVAAVKRIGSTLAAVLGASEPLVAVSIGVLVFHEQFTWRTVLGVACIIGSVLVVMLAPQWRARAARAV